MKPGMSIRTTESGGDEAHEGHDSVTGIAPEALDDKNKTSRPAGGSLKDFIVWFHTQPPSGRTAEEIEAQIREERDSWGD